MVASNFSEITLTVIHRFMMFRITIVRYRVPFESSVANHFTTDLPTSEGLIIAALHLRQHANCQRAIDKTKYQLQLKTVFLFEYPRCPHVTHCDTFCTRFGYAPLISHIPP